ncbi:ATP-binding protein [Polaromonas sp.]|uniref:ATP-binding protein n=1 Tax=Polaromonas sp. TaxID=1869339 RepID=UPI00248845D1|nr:ATP-binding protein [Polaromonas sp.]MDI1275286.1 ATP-binding protein [Polaromonas sp.]
MMPAPDDDDRQLRSVALQNAQTIVRARQQAEGVQVAARDGLEQKTAELALSLSMVRATLEASRDGILVSDDNAHITGFNQQYVRMWGLSDELMAFRDHERLLPEVSRQVEDTRHFLDRVHEIYRHSPAESFDLLQLRDGRIYERTSKIQVVEGQHVGRVWVFRDITEQRRTEDALRKKARVLELLNKTGTILTAKLDVRMLAQAVIDAATEISGAKVGVFFYNTAAPGGNSPFLRTVSGIAAEDFDSCGLPQAGALFDLTLSGAPMVHLDDLSKDARYEATARPGSVAIRSYLAVPVASGSADVIGGLFFGHPNAGVFDERAERLVTGIAAQAGVSIDNARLYEVARQAAQEREKLLDNERAARSEAEQMSRMKDEFLAMLAHELRNPLAPLRASAEILRLGADDPAVLERTRAIMERQIAHMTRLVDDLLDVSRISRGKLELRLEQIPLDDAIRSAAETSRPAIAERQHAFSITMPEQPIKVTADPVRLSQAFTNLLNNAAKYTPEGGSVELRVSANAQGVTVSIEDNGIGVPEHLSTRIFDMFVQGEPSPATPQAQGGLGIGLTLVRKIVEMHGGSIRAESRSDGPGSRFIVWLPVADAAAVAGAGAVEVPASVQPAAGAFEPRRILVTDDNVDAAVTLASLLGMLGHEVRTAHDGAEAIEAAAAFRPDIIFLDIGMPRMDGYEACRRIRALGQVPAPVVVALTGWGQADDKRKAQEAGFDHHFTKPVDPARLEALVGSNF